MVPFAADESNNGENSDTRTKMDPSDNLKLTKRYKTERIAHLVVLTAVGADRRLNTIKV